MYDWTFGVSRTVSTYVPLFELITTRTAEKLNIGDKHKDKEI